MAAAQLDTGDTAWILTSTALVLLMTPGLAFFYGGLAREGHVLNTMMMSLISMGVVAIAWSAVGFSLAFGKGGPLIGDLLHAGLHQELDGQLWAPHKFPALLFVAFQMCFAVVGAAIISGSVAERMRFSAWILFIALWSVLVYAPICHWVWGGGWIEKLGALDFAGGTVVHETTATSALVLAVLLGPRSARPAEPEPHNVPFVILGGGMLWFGWLGFNGGSAYGANQTAALAVLNTCLAGAASMIVWASLERLRNKRTSAVGTMTGAIVGLVIATPGCGHVTPLGAVAMGALGCLLAYPTFLLHHPRVDDTLDVFCCHGISGFIGTMLTGIFARPSEFAKPSDDVVQARFKLLGAQLAGGLAAPAYAAVATIALYFLISHFMRMRVPEEDEHGGVDAALHGEVAYRTHKPREAGSGRPAQELELGSPNGALGDSPNPMAECGACPQKNGTSASTAAPPCHWGTDDVPSTAAAAAREEP